MLALWTADETTQCIPHLQHVLRKRCIFVTFSKSRTCTSTPMCNLSRGSLRTPAVNASSKFRNESLTYLINSPLRSVDGVDVSLLFDSNGGPFGVVEGRSSVNELARSVQPVSGVDLCGWVARGDIKPQIRKAQHKALPTTWEMLT